MLLRLLSWRAESRAEPSAGSSREISRAMIATTTRSSISVKPKA